MLQTCTPLHAYRCPHTRDCFYSETCGKKTLGDLFSMPETLEFKFNAEDLNIGSAAEFHKSLTFCYCVFILRGRDGEGRHPLIYSLKACGDQGWATARSPESRARSPEPGARHSRQISWGWQGANYCASQAPHWRAAGNSFWALL